jgi:hypothetical protein
MDGVEGQRFWAPPGGDVTRIGVITVCQNKAVTPRSFAQVLFVCSETDSHRKDQGHLSALKEPHPALEPFVDPHLFLSEEIILQSNLNITTLNIPNQIKASEVKKYALMLQKYLGIILRRYFLNIIYQTFVNIHHLSSTPTILGLILIISFVIFNQLICIRDEVTVNAWWYLEGKGYY